MRHQDEAQLIEACRSGDREAFRSLIALHQDRVHRVARAFAGDEAAARDIAQDVFVKLWRGLPAFRGDAALSTWLHRLVVRACLDEHRRRRRLLPLFAAVRGRAADCPLRAASRGEEAAIVRAAVASLPPRLRVAVVLRHFEELSYAEMAAALDCSPGTVASRLSRGHALLAERLAALRGRPS